MCPREDSNLDLNLRKVAFYPLNYGDFLLAEARGFEPLRAVTLTVFKTVPFIHSGTPPII